MVLAAVLAVGCARFKCVQADKSYAIETKDGKVITVREITSKTTATTFFEAKSGLVGFKTLQTDKSQSSSIGSLNQEATATNLVAALREAANILEQAAKLKSPIPLP